MEDHSNAFDLARAKAGEKFYSRHDAAKQPMLLVGMSRNGNVCAEQENSGTFGYGLPMDYAMLPKLPERRVLWVFRDYGGFFQVVEKKPDAGVIAKAIWPEPELTDEMLQSACVAFRAAGGNNTFPSLFAMRAAAEYLLRALGYRDATA